MQSQRSKQNENLIDFLEHIRTVHDTKKCPTPLSLNPISLFFFVCLSLLSPLSHLLYYSFLSFLFFSFLHLSLSFLSIFENCPVPYTHSFYYYFFGWLVNWFSNQNKQVAALHSFLCFSTFAQSFFVKMFTKMECVEPTGGSSPVHPDTPTLTRHLLATLANRKDVNGGELFR